MSDRASAVLLGILVWLFGSVVVTIAPVAIDALARGIDVAIYNGQLLLVAISIFGSAVVSASAWETLLKHRQRQIVNVLLFGFTLAFALLAAGLYASYADAELGEPGAHSSSDVMQVSILFLTTALLVGLAHAVAYRVSPEEAG